MEVLEGLPREYVVRLRERVLVDVFWFFRDNNIANSSTLLNALQKYVVFPLLFFHVFFVSSCAIHYLLRVRVRWCVCVCVRVRVQVVCSRSARVALA
jgi:hypothetical protein